MQPEAFFRIRLVVGDWSGDGHSMTEDMWVLSNRDDAALRAAYNRGTQVVGVDLTGNVCQEYEDPWMPQAVFDRLVTAGYRPPWADDPEANGIDPEPEGICMEPEWFAELWLFIASKGDPDLSARIVTGETSINIGGYGLFVR